MKRIFSLALLCTALEAFANQSQPIVLKSEVLSMVDGSFINADIIEFIRSYRSHLISLLLGDKQDENNYYDTYQFEGSAYPPVRILHAREEAHEIPIVGSPELTTIKKHFLSIATKFKVALQGSKHTMKVLVEESCEQRGRINSLLMLWSKIEEDDEDRIFNERITTVKEFEEFCYDLINFLGDLVRSCPKAQAQYKQRIAKWNKCKEITQKALPHLNKEEERSFLRYLKINHLNKMALGEITPGHMESLFKTFKQSS